MSRLHRAIRIGFADTLADVPRSLFIQRLQAAGLVWHIPANFFVLNFINGSTGYIAVDELIFQAISFDYSQDFDKLALVAFNNSYVGRWPDAESWQSHPAPWAYHYILNNVAATGWDTRSVSANHIEKYVSSDERYRAENARKLSTNLNHMYRVGGLSEMATPEITRWWVSAVFLILDRAIAERDEEEVEVPVSRLLQYIAKSGFLDVSGTRSKSKDLALQPIASLYSACGGFRRWSAEFVRERQKITLPELNWFANSDDPFYAIYPEDPHITKAIPRACAMLAKQVAGFEELDPEELVNWNILDYVRRKTRAALAELRSR